MKKHKKQVSRVLKTGNIDLGPQFPGMENQDDPFTLQEPEFYALQAYVESGKLLPTDVRELELIVGIPQEHGSQFNDLLGAYKNVVDHCRNFTENTFPESVRLAGDIVSYNTKVNIYYDVLLDIAQEYQDATSPEEEEELERDFRATIEQLSRRARDFVTHSESVSRLYGEFLEETKADKGHIDPLSRKYHERFDAETGELAQTLQEIERLTEELEVATREYEKAYYKAYKEPQYYGWLGLIGLSVALAMTIKYGEIADQWKARAEAIEAKIKLAQEKAKQAALFLNSLELANDSVASIQKKIDEALPVLARLRGSWLAIDQELNDIVIAIDENFEDLLVRLVRAGIKEMKERWAKVADKAEQYREVAFIVPQYATSSVYAQLQQLRAAA
ncbi:MAG TPA: alpha-xenorhabdolysin family binary toxin subunit A [Ktedonobacteraceae bacterium]|nr:alpha-xenorhabdolysin family binary toxin subunit A [Ktedonobacteraceae bacterium]